MKSFHDRDIFKKLMTPTGLQDLDNLFLSFVKKTNLKHHADLTNYRNGIASPAKRHSDFLIAISQYVESFLVDFFKIQQSMVSYKKRYEKNNILFKFRKHYVSKLGVRKARKKILRNFEELNQWLLNQIQQPYFSDLDEELAVARLGDFYLTDKANYKNQIDALSDWCAYIIRDEELYPKQRQWSIFNLPKEMDHSHLVSYCTEGRKNFSAEDQLKHRLGFQLTDCGMSDREVLSEINHCMFCHKHEGDYCSKGFFKNKNSTEFKINPLGNKLTGCPLGIKISEMLYLAKTGNCISALCVLMIDNPLCALTGHRICNDCMKSCIYQKQKAVDIPQVESKILKDVLALPWGVEIYDLLLRWNPLKRNAWHLKSYNGKKVLIIGSGPSGMATAYYLLQAGCAVVIMDGLKVEPIPSTFLEHPIQKYSHIKEDLDKRIKWGVGGVAEYGITVRWDKNYLKLIYISLMRRTQFRLFGSVRFGGTITVEKAWEQGFDHLVIAAGAGLPKELPIPGSLNVGMRQANDFLMALHLTDLSSHSSKLIYQVKLPAIIIGGGLTAVDTATEVQAYYVKQVESLYQQYKHAKKNNLFSQKIFTQEELFSLKEMLCHGEAIKAERELANSENRVPNFTKLIKKWGGVTLAYRKKMQESPAYRSNHEELKSALNEGILYVENFNPVKAHLDENGEIDAIQGIDVKDKSEICLPAKSIFIATGIKPNVAYAFEHKETFERNGFEYKMYQHHKGKLLPSEKFDHIKDKNIGAFTSYSKNGKFVTCVGDAHPAFHGSVVNALASAAKTYQSILTVLNITETHTKEINAPSDLASFFSTLENQYFQKVIGCEKINKSMIRLTVSAPQAVKMYQPGQFYKIQCYEKISQVSPLRTILPKLTSAYPSDLNVETGRMDFYLRINETDLRTPLSLVENQRLSIMGPTGSRIPSPRNKNILVMGDSLSLTVMSTLGKIFKEDLNTVTYFVQLDSTDEYFPYEWGTVADILIWNLKEQIKSLSENEFLLPDNPVDGLKRLIELNYKDPRNLKEHIINTDVVYFIGRSDKFYNLAHPLKESLEPYFSKKVKYFSFVTGPMQCMLKGICGQCLQWQLDPSTKQRTKAVFACSWQCQPLEIIDFNHLVSRNNQNNLLEKFVKACSKNYEKLLMND